MAKSTAVKTNVVIPVATPRNADGSLDTSALVLEIGIRLAAYANLSLRKEGIDHEMEKLKTANAAVRLQKKDAKKAIDELLPQLRKAQVVVGNLKTCPVAQAIYRELPPELKEQTKSNYLKELREAIKNGTKFSTNSSRDKAAAAVKAAKDETKGILESHARTKDLTAQGKLKLLMPELLALAKQLNNGDLFTIFEEANLIVAKL